MRATMDQWTSRRSARPAVRLGAVSMAFFLSVSFSASLAETGASTVEAAAGCRIYVASGDDVTNGKAMDANASRYPEKLLADKIKAPGWCLYNQGKNGQTSATYITGGGLASAYNMRPDFLTIQLGEQNSTIVNLVTSCFEKVKGHDFSGATACASQILGNSSLWTNLRSNYTTILQQTRIMAAQRPQLVVAVVNYPNPYPQSTDVVDEIATLCVPLVDTIPTCTTRWSQLPPALLALDKVFQKLNQTLKESVAPFQAAPNGSRWVYVDTYPRFKDHCMTMKVTIKTKVEHPEEIGSRSPARLARGQLRMLRGVVRRGVRRDRKAELPPAGRARRPRRLEPDHQGDGRLPERRRPQVHLGSDLGSRHDRSRHHAPEVEAGLRGGGQLEHLSVTSPLDGWGGRRAAQACRPSSSLRRGPHRRRALARAARRSLGLTR